LIQNIRYAGSFDYEFDVGENVLDLPTLKLTLQPIVENCIYHGLKNKIDRGLIKISARVDDGALALTVADNGYGMRPEAVSALYASFGGGMAEGRIADGRIVEGGMAKGGMAEGGIAKGGMAEGGMAEGGDSGDIGVNIGGLAGGATGGGVGLKNIWQRMVIYYHGKAGILIESELDEGTSITLKGYIT
jgi:two-component system sensor histidine kinase YesM